MIDSDTVNSKTEIDESSLIYTNVVAGGKKKYVYIAKAAPIENVVFSGGGAKGVVYPGVIKALKDQKIKNVAGSSIGAVTAALYAAGMTGEQFESVTRKQDFKELLGSINSSLHKSGDPLLSFVRKQMAGSVLLTLANADVDAFTAKYDQLSDHEKSVIHTVLNDHSRQKPIRDLLIEIKNKIEEKKKEKNDSILVTDDVIDMISQQPITFSMLDTLRQFNDVAGINGAFKDLSVTSVCQENGELYIFNGNNTPNLEIALGVRASASLPVILQPVAIPKDDLGIYAQGEGSLHFVDGGYLDNIPVAVVDAKQKKEKGANLGEQGQNLQTLAFVFDETTNEPYKAGFQSPYFNANEFNQPDLYIPGLKEKVLRNILPRIRDGLKTKIKNTQAKARGLKLISTDYTQRNVPLLVAGIASQDFVDAKNRADELMKSSENATREYLENHKDELIYLSFDDPVSAALGIPPQKLDKMIDKQSTEYDLSTSELIKIREFRNEIGSIIGKSKPSNVLKNISLYLAKDAKLNEQYASSYYEYITDQLHADKTTWNAIFKKENQPSNLNRHLMYSISKRDAQDKLLEKQKELANWITQEINKQNKKLNELNKNADENPLTETNRKNIKRNIELLDKAKEDVIRATTFKSLSDALAPVKADFHDEVKKLTMLNLFRKSGATSTAEKHILSIDEQSLKYDGFLSASYIKEQSQRLADMTYATQSSEDVKKEQDTTNKAVALIDIDSLVTPEDARVLINSLREKGITDVYITASINPDSLVNDILIANQNKANEIKTPEPIIKVFQREGFNTTVITPMDSASKEIKMGSTYRDGIQPHYDRMVTGNLGVAFSEEKASVRAQSIVAYENTLLRKLDTQERNEASILGIMHKKFAKNIPDNVSSVVYFGKSATPPQALSKAKEDISIYAIDATSSASIQRQFSSLSLPEFTGEAKKLAIAHFNQNDQWKMKFAEAVQSIEAYVKNLNDTPEKNEVLNILRIKTMHGSYEEKLRLLVIAMDNYMAEKNVKRMTDPLHEIKSQLDGFITRNDRGFYGLYLKVLGKLDIKTLGVKKMEFAKRYRDRVDAVLSVAGQEQKNDLQLRGASNAFIAMFKKDHKDVYAGNEADMQSKTCRFKQCIDKVKEPLKKLKETANIETPRMGR